MGGASSVRVSLLMVRVMVVILEPQFQRECRGR